MRFITLLLLLFIPIIGCDEKYTSDIKKAYNATCKIETETSIGTGVVLDTGYILTASHVVDINDNGILDSEELICKVHFSKDCGVSEIQTGSVLFIGNPNINKLNDFAVIVVTTPPESDISLMTKNEFSNIRIGEECLTIGMAGGEEAHITEGRIDFKKEGELNRATCTIIPGNSGGAIFVNDKIAGIVIQCSVMPVPASLYFMIPMQTEEGLTFISCEGSISVNVPVSNLTVFIPADEIINRLTDNNMKFVLHKVFKNRLLEVVAAVFLNLILLAALIYNGQFFTKKLFRKKMR